MLHTSVALTQLFWVSFSKIGVPGRSLSNFLPTFKFLIINTEVFFFPLPKKMMYLVCNNKLHSS